MRAASVLAATGAGAAIGWVCGLVQVLPVVRIAVASVMGAFVGAAVSSVVVVLSTEHRSANGGLGAVSFGVSDAVLLGVPAAVLVVVVGYVALRWLGWSQAGLATYGPTIVGGVAALVAALWVARGLAISGTIQG